MDCLLVQQTHAITCYPHSSLHPQSGILYECFPSHTVFLRIVLQLIVTANVVPISQIFISLMMEAMRSSETWVLRRAIWHDIPEDSILHNHIITFVIWLCNEFQYRQ
jgi:hypothetical protein